MKHTFHENNVVQRAIAAQTIATTATANGTRIIRPGPRGRQLSFTVDLSNAAQTTSALVIKVQGSNDGGTTWVALKDNAGNDLAFPSAAAIAAANTVGGKMLIGTIWPERFTGYTDFRLAVTTNTGDTLTISAVAILSELYVVPPLAVAGDRTSGNVVDQLLALFLPVGDKF